MIIKYINYDGKELLNEDTNIIPRVSEYICIENELSIYKVVSVTHNHLHGDKSVIIIIDEIKNLIY